MAVGHYGAVGSKSVYPCRAESEYSRVGSSEPPVIAFHSFVEPSEHPPGVGVGVRGMAVETVKESVVEYQIGLRKPASFGQTFGTYTYACRII